MNIALQLYTLRNELEEDFIGTLQQVRTMGYKAVELAGQNGGFGTEELAGTMKNIGLQIVSSHVPFEELQDDLDGVIEKHLALGCRHIVCPYLDEEKRSSLKAYKQTAKELNRIGKACRKEGITFSYHNHDFELLALEGRLPFEVMLEEMKPEHVQVELDTYWVQKAGEDPFVWMERLRDRLSLVHIKDMTADGEEFFAELGEGKMDIEAIMKEAEESGASWQIVEQDASRRKPLESVRISMDYIQNTFV
ncbi:sugar phosphate isomerase/epimerase family protein [Marinococcus halotolerans]|uniref:sugar phosphate isomerase/epimerase family protein n=1 Tax=Marinococcus halotolerans TaxID=301092 RepID=UPI0003B6F7BA|nr:sugar phosphate isomerase/epimerase family protein [Marinococcus halotolerans]